MEDENIVDQLQQHAIESPLFEPEQPKVPIAVMIPPVIPSSSSISSHIAKLRAIEGNARAALASWNESSTGSTIPSKRPGM